MSGTMLIPGLGLSELPERTEPEKIVDGEPSAQDTTAPDLFVVEPCCYCGGAHPEMFCGNKIAA